MDQSLQPFIDGQTRRAALPVSQVTEDIVGTLDWLSKGAAVSGKVVTCGITSVPVVICLDGDSPNDRVPATPCRAAPAWSSGSVHGCLSALVGARPGETLKAIRSFFADEVPAVIAEGPWQLSTTAFVDFAPIDVEVHVFGGMGSEKAVVSFRHSSQQDVVRFHRLWHAAAEHLAQKGLSVAPMGRAPAAGRAPAPALLDWDSLEDAFEDELQGCWHLRVAAAMEAAASADGLVRQEGLQMLASLAQSLPEARAAIAEALQSHAGWVEALLGGTLTSGALLPQVYPLSVTLKFVTLQSAVPPSVATLISRGAAAATGLPPIVARELLEAHENLARGA